MITVEAVYENGVLRPDAPLDLAEGENVRIDVYSHTENAQPKSSVETESDVIRRMNGAKTIQELFAIYESHPALDGGYDLCEALNANRKETGERLLYTERDNGEHR